MPSFHFHIPFLVGRSIPFAEPVDVVQLFPTSWCHPWHGRLLEHWLGWNVLINKINWFNCPLLSMNRLLFVASIQFCIWPWMANSVTVSWWCSDAVASMPNAYFSSLLLSRLDGSLECGQWKSPWSSPNWCSAEWQSPWWDPWRLRKLMISIDFDFPQILTD
jgi:hypothetical protein